MPPEVEEKLRQLVDLRAAINEFSDDEVGPWYFADGSKYEPGWGGLRGAPPERHPRRCHAQVDESKRTARWSWGPIRSKDSVDVGNRVRRCRRWAVTGRENCQFHGGRGALGTLRLPLRYTQRLAPALRDRLEQQLEQSRPEQLRIYDEIGVARVFAEEQIVLAGALLEAEVEGKDPQSMLLLKMKAIELAKDAMTHIADMCSKAAAIEKNLTDKVGVEQLGLFVQQVMKVLHRHLGNSDLIDVIAEDMRTKIMLPEDPNTNGKHAEIIIDFGDDEGDAKSSAA
jgi:hypothetical protein